ELQVIYSADDVSLKETTQEVVDSLGRTEKEFERQQTAAKRLAESYDPIARALNKLERGYQALEAAEKAGAITPAHARETAAALDLQLTKVLQMKTAQQQLAEEVQRSATAESAAREKVAQETQRASAAQSAAVKKLMEEMNPLARAFNQLDERFAHINDLHISGALPTAQYHEFAAAVEKDRTALYAMADAAEQAGHELGAVPVALSHHEMAAKRAGISVGQYTQALRFLPMQMTDVVTQLAGGQNPLLILIEQGGQVRDSFGGIRPALVAVLGALNPVTLGIGALVATVLAIPVSMHFASQAFDTMSDALTLTGAAAFDTTGKMAEAAERVGNATNSSFAATAEMMSGLVEQGKYTGEQIETITRTTQAWSQATGTAAKDIEHYFSSIADSPVQSMKALNNQYDFLTAAQAKSIVALDKSGEHTKAATVLMDLFADTMDKRVKDIADGMSPLETAWNDVKKWASDTFMAVGIDFNAMASMVIDTVGAMIDQIRGLIAHGDDYIFQALATITDKAAKIPGMQSVFDPMTESARAAAKEQQGIWQDVEKDNAERLARMGAGLQGYRDQIWKGNQIQKGPGQKDAVAGVVDDSKKNQKAYQDDEGTKRLATLKEQAASLREQSDTAVKLTDSEKKWAAFQQEIAGYSAKNLTAAQQSVLAKRGEIEAQLQINIGLEKALQHQALAKKMMEEQQSIQLTTAKMKQQIEDDVSGITQSHRVVEQNKAESQIHEEFAARRTQLDKEVTDHASVEYQRQTEFLRSEEQKRIDISRQGAKDRAAAEQDFLGGASAGMQDWVDTQSNLADRARQATVGMFDSMSGAVANFAVTGKMNFR
ncbi:MAG TPA: phage tail length tape measure family protein, partial [Candidatus Sulfotelmatobacter sp.]